MARLLDNELSLISHASIESSATYSIIETPTKAIKIVDDGNVPIFLFVGPKIKLLRWVRLVCFFIIYLMFTAYVSNARVLLESITKNIFNNGSIIDEPNTLTYLLPTLLNGVPPLLSVFFGFVSDYEHHQRTYMLSYSFVSSLSSGFILMLCSFLITLENRYLEIQEIMIALILLSITFHIIGVSIFLPISLGYGLDLLEGTKWEVKYLFFPIYYVVQNVAYFAGVLRYVYFPSETYFKESSIAVFSLMVCIFTMFTIFRLLQILPSFHKPKEFDVISFKTAFEIFSNSLKVRMKGQKSPRGHWFIQLSSDAHYGKYPRKYVQMVASFFEINILFMFIFMLFTTTQAKLAIFPKQGLLLRLPVSHMIQSPCPDPSSEFMYSLIWVNFLTIVVLTPFIESYFYKIIFFHNSTENLRNFEKKKSLWQTFLKCLRCCDRYWHVYDPILKRIFWGSIFSTLSLVSALCVEIARVTTLDLNSTCEIERYSQVLSYRFSTTSIFAQIPQYVLSGILEIVSYIGCLQFIYFHSNSTYKDQLKGLFFGLYYFYIGLAIVVSNLIYYLFGAISESRNICLSYTSACDQSDNPLTWILFLPLVMLSSVVLITFACFAHYRHYQLSRIDVEEMCMDEEG